jgi:hypothetical protein
MQLRRLYQSRLLVLAITLIVLGVGNTIIGSQKLRQYQSIVAEGRARGYFPDAAGSTDRILRPLDDEGERYNIGRAKVDLYHVVLSGGLVMMAVGVVLTIIGWLRVRLRARTAESVRPGSELRSA